MVKEQARSAKEALFIQPRRMGVAFIMFPQF